MTTVQATPSGSIPVSAAPEDIAGAWSYSLDMRRETGGTEPDGSAWAPPGTFTRPVFPTLPGHHPIGEVILVIAGQTVHVVGARTDRDAVEVTADEVRAMRKNAGYAATMRAWLVE